MFRRVELGLTDLAAGVIPWLAPIPSAWLVGRASVEYLAWPVPVAVIAAAIVEGLGLSSVATALELREYNATRRKAEPPAPFWLAALLAGVYLATAVTLVVLLDLVPSLAHVAPAIFPALSLVGAMILAIRADHRRRLATIAGERAEQKAEKAARRMGAQNAQGLHTLGAHGQPPKADPTTAAVGQNGAQFAVLDNINRTRAAQRAALLDALLDAYRDNPDLGATEAARALGVHRNSIYNYTDELIAAGRLHKNGAGWEVR